MSEFHESSKPLPAGDASTPTPGPLADLRVIELATIIAGPGCGKARLAILLHGHVMADARELEGDQLTDVGIVVDDEDVAHVNAPLVRLSLAAI